ncbi:MAG: hypothetical protein ABI619_06790, partial [Betaproteobacteria bacterium]
LQRSAQHERLACALAAFVLQASVTRRTLRNVFLDGQRIIFFATTTISERQRHQPKNPGG